MPRNDMDMTNFIGRNVLVTGGAGFVGSNLVDSLRAYGGDAVSEGPRTEGLPLPRLSKPCCRLMPRASPASKSRSIVGLAGFSC